MITDLGKKKDVTGGAQAITTCLLLFLLLSQPSTAQTCVPPVDGIAVARMTLTIDDGNNSDNDLYLSSCISLSSGSYRFCALVYDTACDVKARPWLLPTPGTAQYGSYSDNVDGWQIVCVNLTLASSACVTPGIRLYADNFTCTVSLPDTVFIDSVWLVNISNPSSNLLTSSNNPSFERWTGGTPDGWSADQDIAVDSCRRAGFTGCATPTPQCCIVISEFQVNMNVNDGRMYNTGEWVEIYNRCSSPIDISCWILCMRDYDNSVQQGECFVIPSGTLLNGGDVYLFGSSTGTACASCDWPSASIDLDWHNCGGCVSEFDGGDGKYIGVLTNEGEDIVLFDNNGNIIDALTNADGTGAPSFAFTVSAYGSCPATTVTIPASSQLPLRCAGSGTSGYFADNEGCQLLCNGLFIVSNYPNFTPGQPPGCVFPLNVLRLKVGQVFTSHAHLIVETETPHGEHAVVETSCNGRLWTATGELFLNAPTHSLSVPLFCSEINYFRVIADGGTLTSNTVAVTLPATLKLKIQTSDTKILIITEKPATGTIILTDLTGKVLMELPFASATTIELPVHEHTPSLFLLHIILEQPQALNIVYKFEKTSRR